MSFLQGWALFFGYLVVGFICAQITMYIGDDYHDGPAIGITIGWPVLIPIFVVYMTVVGMLKLHEKCYKWMKRR